MNSKKLRIALIACGMIAAASPAWASTTVTTTFNITGTVVGVCLVTVPALSFGAAIPAIIPSSIDSSVNMTVICASGTPYTISLSVGGGAGATFATRKLTSGSNTMEYSLYTDSSRTIVWGDGLGGSSVTVTSIGNGLAQTIPLYGRIPAQTVAIGAYADTITVTMTY